MEGFDNPGIFFSDNFSVDETSESQGNLQASKKKFKEFIRQFHEGNFNYKYRYIIYTIILWIITFIFNNI